MTRSVVSYVVAFPLVVAFAALPAIAQSANAQTATHVSAEMVKGKLNPAASKPGDQVAVRLKEDLKTNGEVVLKRGSTITGVVKNVQRVDSKTAAKGQAQSMIEIEWLVPPAQGKASKQVMIALQSVTHTHPLYAQEEESSDADFALASQASAASSGSVSGGGLLGGVLGGATSAVSSIGSSVGVASGTAMRTQSRSNTALLSMPTVVAADSQTSAALQDTFGMSSDQQLFKTGRGEVVSAGGSKHNVDIFSHFSNDTVLTSPSNNFEISSGAQMQLLVGVQK